VGPSIRERAYVGAVLGALVGGLTTAVESLAGMSDHLLIALAQRAAMVLILPGLFGSAIASGNLHAFSQAIAALINGIIYFAVGWLVCPLWTRIRRLWAG